MKRLFIILSILFLVMAEAKDLSKKDMTLEKVFESSDEVIWGFAFLGKNKILLNIKSGKLIQFNMLTKSVKEIPIPGVHAYGQGGLLDIQIFNIDGLPTLYITYSSRVKGIKTTSLAWAKITKESISSFENIFNAKVKSSKNVHFGSRLAYDGKHLFMTVGDRGERVFAQDLNYHQGKVLRLNPDGSAAKDNPFQKEGLAEIWTYGHRNPQGIYYSKKESRLYSCEFGPRGGDELNVIERSKNYGWPIITYGREYYGPRIGTTSKEGMEQPLAYWVPSISPSGMTIYDGEKIKKWKGDIFLANLSSRHIRRIKVRDKKVIEQQKLLEDLEERIRFIRTGPDGYIYFSTDSGILYRIKSLKDKSF